MPPVPKKLKPRTPVDYFSRQQDHDAQDARDIEDLTRELLEHIQAQPEGEFTRTVDTTEDVEVTDDDGNTQEVEVEVQTERPDEDWLGWLAELNRLEGRLSQARAMRDAGLAARRMSEMRYWARRPGD